MQMSAEISYTVSPNSQQTSAALRHCTSHGRHHGDNRTQWTIGPMKILEFGRKSVRPTGESHKVKLNE